MYFNVHKPNSIPHMTEQRYNSNLTLNTYLNNFTIITHKLLRCYMRMRNL